MVLINQTHKSILSMQDLMILHANNIYPQSSRDDFKAYKHLHGIDMQIHSITKSPNQKAQEMELSELHHEEFKIFALEYNIITLNLLMNLTTMSTHYKDIKKTSIQESMTCSLVTWIQHYKPCKCKIPMC
jgi:ribosomal protein L30E